MIRIAIMGFSWTVFSWKTLIKIMDSSLWLGIKLEKWLTLKPSTQITRKYRLSISLQFRH
jgi:hypothetical protein